MMQLLQTMMADREAERAERQANLAALQQIAQNNQGHGNHDHPGSKLKNFQNTNPPMFSKTEEPLDADDWLQTIENNLEVAGVEAAEKVLFATHYLSGPARAWWTSARAMNAGQMMTWEDFKLKFSKYHVPQGLIKKMRDEFRELKQGRMSVVEYRDRFLTLSRYAPDETDTNEKRKESFLNGLHDEMQTVLVNIPFADLEALVDSAIQMEGKLHQANENRKRRMMNQSGPHHTQKHHNNSSGGFTPRNNRPPAQTYRPNYSNNHGGPPKPGGNNNNNRNPNSHHNNGNNTNTNTELEVMPSPSPRRTNQRKSVSLLLLDLPDLCSTLIKPYTAPIEVSIAGVRRGTPLRIRPPQATPRPPFDSSSSTTSPHTQRSPAGASVAPSTPYLAGAASLLPRRQRRRSTVGSASDRTAQVSGYRFGFNTD
ncbi:hypothetical protein QYE76_004054 [Lolium multiflorum]|uniref:Retrotransposon gag domain-containing protein n=1 Tax=Lolium multiflorum TaxID=4521 RepID=A0AAD8RRB5_LOLMU|nr:hypothetical protein QYE76_004054 [Lolium multiflorum]